VSDLEVGVTDERTTAADPSFDEWVEARVAALLRFAYLVTGSQHAAEDAVQAALTPACERWSRVRRTTDPDAYVRRMVVNAHISAWRRSGRRELAVAEVRDTETADHAVDIATGDAVWRVCATLPPQQRAAVVLRFYEDLEYAEIAAVLGVAQATARSHVHRALAAMRSELEQEDHDG
jgi:RNA polymerase sigma-70 factor (sigma-E family)